MDFHFIKLSNECEEVTQKGKGQGPFSKCAHKVSCIALKVNTLKGNSNKTICLPAQNFKVLSSGRESIMTMDWQRFFSLNFSVLQFKFFPNLSINIPYFIKSKLKAAFLFVSFYSICQWEHLILLLNDH